MYVAWSAGPYMVTVACSKGKSRPASGDILYRPAYVCVWEGLGLFFL